MKALNHGAIDAINENLSAAIAIVDCVRVLTALERAPCPPLNEGGMNVGEGYAGGVVVRDDSMPDALYHAMQLMKSIYTTVNGGVE